RRGGAVVGRRTHLRRLAGADRLRRRRGVPRRYRGGGRRRRRAGAGGARRGGRAARPGAGAGREFGARRSAQGGGAPRPLSAQRGDPRALRGGEEAVVLLRSYRIDVCASFRLSARWQSLPPEVAVGQRDRIVRLDRGVITIHDRAALKEVAGMAEPT